MSLKDTMAADVFGVFLIDKDFADTIGYTPANGGTMRGILAEIEDEIEENLNQVSAAANFRVKRIRVSAMDNTSGVIKPNRLGMPGEGGGDVIALPSSKDPFQATWYVRKILDSDGFMHRLLIVDSQAAATV